ncbi:MAG: TonB-dependent receptor [Muribaculaceae bacterium]|nr:TonB-dependent receptor [Muribaculaceae bacterium]
MDKRTIILAFGLSLCTGAFAQGLHKEITVEQEIVPQKRDASRITVLPTVTLPTIQPARLNYSDRVVTSRVPNAITTLEPIAFGDKLYTSPYKGYVALGIFPLFNADFSAGYRLIDTDKTRLSAWGQYNGDVYTEKIKGIVGGTIDSKKLYWRDHTASVGADLHQAIGEKSYLDAELNYTYGYHNMPIGISTLSQASNRINATLAFNSRTEGLLYSVGVDYRHFGFNDAKVPSTYEYIFNKYDYSPVKQNRIGADFKGLLPVGESSFIGLDADAHFLMTSAHNVAVFPYLGEAITEGSKTNGLVSLTPHYLYTASHATVRIGAQVDFSINDGKAVHVAPDVTLAWTPTQTIGMELRAHGGSTLNELSSLYDVTPYINGSLAYSHSHTPYALDAKVALGPFMGTSIEFFGGYAKADKWLMPIGSLGYIAGQIFDPVDLKGWHLGVALGYEYRKIASARVSYETAPNDYDNSYYEWRDRAKHVVKAELKLRPVRPLLVTIDWEFRAGRRMYNYSAVPETDSNIYGMYTTSLGATSTLNIGAGYEFNDRLTFFVRGENLLNRRYMHLGERRSQGITGLIGASFKF